MKITRKIIEIDEERCDGCGNCVTGCAEGALQIIDGKARLVSDNICDGLGACIGECPKDALTIVEREAEPFDEAAVEAHLAETEETPARATGTKAPTGGCPAAGIQVFSDVATAGKTDAPETAPSALGHWPIKLRLIPPHAPFLKNADILVLADCAAAAYPALQQEMMQGRVVMMGCPKFEDRDAHVEKLARIFANAGIKSVTTLFMEVPCCSGLTGVVRNALSLAKADIPYTEVMVTRRGKIADSPRIA